MQILWAVLLCILLNHAAAHRLKICSSSVATSLATDKSLCPPPFSLARWRVFDLLGMVLDLPLPYAFTKQIVTQTNLISSGSIYLFSFFLTDLIRLSKNHW
jgi:hypothetical protein